MKVRDREYVGRSGRGRDANALVTPVAERTEDGIWINLTDARALFPRNGQIEVRGILANSLRDGDWVIFGSIPNDRHGSPANFRASTPRRLSSFLPSNGSASVEERRRLVVETGIEGGPPGDWSVQIGADAFVRVKLVQGEDGRLRASGVDLASLPLWRFTSDLTITLDGDQAPRILCDHQRSEQLPGTVNWSRDEDYIRMAAAALGPERRGPDVAHLLAWALRQHTDALTGRVSTLAGADAGILAEIERSGVLADRLSGERDLLNLFKTGLRADPAVMEYLELAAAEAAAAALPSLEIEARASIERGMAAERLAAHEHVQALIKNLEAEEIASLEARYAAEAAKRDADLAEARRKGLEEVDAAVAGRLSQVEEAVAATDARRTVLEREVKDLTEHRRSLETAVTALAEEERNKLEIVERLIRAGDDASALRKPTAQAVLPPWPAEAEAERRLGIQDLAGLANETGLLTPSGLDTFLRIGVLIDSGEIPVLHGPDTGDLVEVVALLMAAGRIAKLYADPTLITFDDLWTRAGSGVPTPLAAALSKAAEGRPTIGLVEGADRSAARFWYPQLADAAHRGRLPSGFMPLVAVSDPECEEASLISAVGPLVAVDGVFADGAAAAAPLALAEMSRNPTVYLTEDREFDPTGSSKFLRRHGGGLGLAASMRFSRIHAAALAALGQDDGTRLAVAMKVLIASPDATVLPTGTPKPYLAVGT